MSDAPTGSSPEAADTTRAEAIEAGARAAWTELARQIRINGADGLGLKVPEWDELHDDARRQHLRDERHHYDAMVTIIERAACERHQDAMVTLSAGHVRAMGEARAERDKAVEQARVEERERVKAESLGFIWTNPLTGEQLMLAPQDVAVVYPEPVRAQGGPVPAGRMYLIGENGPEDITRWKR